ncbi:hypothetical protein PO909_017831 [Leuciscus waleckii]
MKKNCVDDRKHGTHRINFCPAASCGPFEVRGFSASLWPNDSCANRGVRVKEDGKNELPKRGKNAKANLPTQLTLAGVSQNQHLPQQTHTFLQKNTSVLQKNKEKLQTSVELQTNACSLRDDKKALMHLPKIMPESQQEKNAYSTEKEKNMEGVEKAEWNPMAEDWSLTPWLDNVSDDDHWFDEWFEEVSCQVELKKNEKEKISRQNVILPKIVPKPGDSVKQPNSSSALPLPPLGNRRPDKTSKAQRAHKKTNLPRKNE